MVYQIIVIIIQNYKDKIKYNGRKIVGVNWTNTLNSNDTYENKLDELEYVLKILNDLPAHPSYDPELHNFRKLSKIPKFKNTTVIDIKGYRMIDRVNTLDLMYLKIMNYFKIVTV